MNSDRRNAVGRTHGRELLGVGSFIQVRRRLPSLVFLIDSPSGNRIQ